MQHRIVHRLLRAQDWQERPEFEQVLEWWRSSRAGVCALVGMGGAGKTAVADQFLRVLPGVTEVDPALAKDESLSIPRAVFVFSFYHDNPELFFAELADWLGRSNDDSAKAPSYNQIIALLRGVGTCLIVMDGLEKIQSDGSREVIGRLESGYLRDFVLRIADGLLPGVRILITTRFSIAELEEERPPLYVPLKVDELHVENAIALLQRRGLSGSREELRAIADEWGRHALSVSLVGGLIKEFGREARPAPLSVKELREAELAEEDPRRRAIKKQEHRFTRIAEQYREHLALSDPAALILLNKICLFRLSVTEDLLAIIFTGQNKEKLSGPELAELTRNGLRDKLKRLTALSLIEAGPAHEPNTTSYNIHPAVRDGFKASMDRETIQLGHEAVREGLSASIGGLSNLVENPSDPQLLDTLEEICYHNLATDQAAAAWDVYRTIMGGVRNLSQRLGQNIRAERICRAVALGRTLGSAEVSDHFDPWTEYVILVEWSITLYGLGHLDTAAQCLRSLLDSQPNMKSSDRSLVLYNLSHCLAVRGRTAAALNMAEQVVELASKDGDIHKQQSSRKMCAWLRYVRGDLDGALTDFSEFTRLGNILNQDTAENSTFEPPGIIHILNAMHGTSPEKVRRTMIHNVSIMDKYYGAESQESHSFRLVSADMAIMQKDFQDARDSLEMANNWAIAHDDRRLILECLEVRAKLEIAMRQEFEAGDLTEAKSSIQEGLLVAADCGYGLAHITLSLDRAHLALLEGRIDDALLDIAIAVDGGVEPDMASGRPDLPAARHPECAFRPGEARGLKLRAEVVLLQAARLHGRQEFAPARRDGLPGDVRKLLEEGETLLEECRVMYDRMEHMDLTATMERIEELAGGVLTSYPLAHIGATATQESKLQNKDPANTVKGKHRTIKHIFLSYCRDNKENVAKLREDLIAAGEKVWWDQDIKIGQNWKTAIRDALQNSFAAVLCWSAEAQSRVKSGTYPEIRDIIGMYRALAPGTLFILPVRFSECKLPDFEIDSTTRLADIQYTDLFPGDEYEDGLKKILTALKAAASHS